MNIGFIGTGNVATNLGNLFQQAGHRVMFGARNAAQEQEKLQSAWQQPVAVRDFQTVAIENEIIVFAIPYLAVKEVGEELKELLKGKIVVDLTNPLNTDWSPVVLGAENSAGEEVARLLPGSKVVKAFNTIFADVMKPEKPGAAQAKITAFICGDHPQARQVVADVANSAGFEAVITGDMKNARYVEAMAHLNIQLAVGMKGGTAAAFSYLKK